MSDSDRLRREAVLARQVLGGYDIAVARLHLLKRSWNTIFRVDTRGGDRYVLRLSRPGVRDRLLIESELAWIDVLARDTDIPVPVPVRTRDSSLLVEISAPEESVPRYGALFGWIGGRHVIHSFSDRTIALLGETMARLHDHAETFVPPEHFTRQRFDRIGSFAETSVIWADEPHPLVDGERQSLFRREADRVQVELDRLYSRPIPPRFLHLDLHLGNVKLLRGRLAVLDFDDSMWAFPVQDIAVSLYYLRYLRGLGSDVRAPFREGYTRLREWPEEWDGQVDLLTEARALDLVDVLLSIENPQIQAHLPRHMQGVEDQIRELARAD